MKVSACPHFLHTYYHFSQIKCTSWEGNTQNTYDYLYNMNLQITPPPPQYKILGLCSYDSHTIITKFTFPVSCNGCFFFFVTTISNAQH